MQPKTQIMLSNTPRESVAQALGNEPAQLRNPWYYWIKCTLTLPFRAVTWPIRYLLMFAICPMSRFYEEITQSDSEVKMKFNVDQETLENGEIGTFKLKAINYTISDNDKCRMVLAWNQGQSEEVKDRKLVINFGGNGQPILGRIYKLENLKSNSDIIFVEYPKGATYSQELVDGGVSAVLRAINAGYKPENITIAGHSLGGAVGALVLRKMKHHLQQEQKFAEYINHRSFKDLGAFVAAQAETSQDGWLRKTINLIAWAFRVQLDAEEAIKSGLPVNKITAHYDEKDEIIKPAASIGKAIEDGELQPGVNTEVVRTDFCEHNNFRSNTLYGAEESYDYRKYIQARQEIAPTLIAARV